MLRIYMSAHVLSDMENDIALLNFSYFYCNA